MKNVSIVLLTVWHFFGQVGSSSCPLSFRGSPYWMAPEVLYLKLHHKVAVIRTTLSFVVVFNFSFNLCFLLEQVIMNTNGYNWAVDVWSLGCTVIEMATSKPPWMQYEGVGLGLFLAFFTFISSLLLMNYITDHCLLLVLQSAFTRSLQYLKLETARKSHQSQITYPMMERTSWGNVYSVIHLHALLQHNLWCTLL